MVAAALVAVGGVLVVGNVQRQAEAQRAADAQAAAAAQEAEQQQQAAERAAAEAEEQRQLQQAQISIRRSSVKEIEQSVLKMARGHASDGAIEGWPKAVRCSPKAGQNIANLSKTTTSFSCFVITERNSDGTASGHYYQALMNWDTGKYTYGYGQ